MKKAKAIATSKILVNLREFARKDLSEYAESFGRFLRMTGQTQASGRVKLDLLLQWSKTKYLEKQVKEIVIKSATFAEVLVALERPYRSYQTNLSRWTEIQNLAMLPKNPKAARISELLDDLDHWVGRLTPRSYGSHEILFWLVAKIPADAWDECRATAECKARSLTYEACQYFYWSWRWTRRVTSTSTPTAPEEATLGTMAVGIKDLDLDTGLPLRMLAT